MIVDPFWRKDANFIDSHPAFLAKAKDPAPAKAAIELIVALSGYTTKYMVRRTDSPHPEAT
jgi:hypothetical protein